MAHLRDEFTKEFGSPENKSLITLYEGTEDGLKVLREMKLGLGVLSNGSMKSLQRDLGDLFSYFKFVIAEANKPDPTIFLNELSKVGLRPEVRHELVVFWWTEI